MVNQGSGATKFHHSASKTHLVLLGSGILSSPPCQGVPPGDPKETRRCEQSPNGLSGQPQHAEFCTRVRRKREKKSLSGSAGLTSAHSCSDRVSKQYRNHAPGIFIASSNVGLGHELLNEIRYQAPSHLRCARVAYGRSRHARIWRQRRSRLPG
jgi:hypothetical protein